MGSTLRSLVLRYKAEIKEFQKGNRRVIDDIKQTKRDVGGLSKEMGKAFDPKVDRMRDQIKRLNSQFREGRLDVHKYGTAVDQLKQKIAGINRMSQIRSHEIGALRSRNFAAASADKNLRNAFSVGMVESADSIRARMSADMFGGGGNTAAAAAGFMSMKNFGTWGKVAKVAGPASALGKIAWGVGGRASELSAGGRSEVLGPMSRPVGDTIRGAGAIGGHIFQGIEDGLLGLLGVVGDYATFGAVSRYGAKIKADENLATANKEAREKVAERQKLVDAGRAPVDELRAEQRINALVKDRDYMEIQSMARRAEENDDLENSARLYAKMADMERASATAAKERAEAGKQYKEAVLGSVWVDLEKQLAISRDIMQGATPNEAAVRAAGGDRQSVLRARGIDLEMQRIDELMNPAQKARAGGSWDWMFDPGMQKIKADREKVKQFGNQFRSPQELFQDNLREIQSMMTLGLDPALARRAMMANARGVAGEANIGRFASNIEVGSHEDRKFLEEQRRGARDEKHLARLVQIQEEALRAAKDKGGEITVNITEVSF